MLLSARALCRVELHRWMLELGSFKTDEARRRFTLRHPIDMVLGGYRTAPIAM